MSSSVDDDSTAIVYSDKHIIPVNLDGSMITWDKNDASIDGVLMQFGKWSKRNDTFESLFNDHAVSYKGKIYLDTANSAYFLTGAITDSKPYDFSSPCPPTPARLKVINDSLLLALKPVIDPSTLTPVASTNPFIINNFEVRNHKARLLTSLNYLFGQADWAEDLTDDAMGDGLKYLELIRQSLLLWLSASGLHLFHPSAQPPFTQTQWKQLLQTLSTQRTPPCLITT